MAWVTPQHTRSYVDVAGKRLISGDFRHLKDALAVINNWRASHAFPLLSMRMTLFKRASKVDPRALVFQRLKRISSIRLQLTAQNDMRLSRMHDIGGCRAVVRTARSIDRFVQVYEQRLVMPEFVRKYDYIETPKTDGYRSVHLVYKYQSQSATRRVYNGLRIELQIRSRVQHAWAAAVETVSAFTGQALKSNVGEDTWKRFFLLMSSAIAIMERRKTVPGTATTLVEFKDELRELVEQLQVLDLLPRWAASVAWLTEETHRSSDYYLLTFDPSRGTASATGFTTNELPAATDRYIKDEEDIIRKDLNIQAVLVSARTIRGLKTGYPNYRADTSGFVKLVKQVLDAKA